MEAVRRDDENEEGMEIFPHNDGRTSSLNLTFCTLTPRKNDLQFLNSYYVDTNTLMMICIICITSPRDFTTSFLLAQERMLIEGRKENLFRRPSSLTVLLCTDFDSTLDSAIRTQGTSHTQFKLYTWKKR